MHPKLCNTIQYRAIWRSVLGSYRHHFCFYKCQKRHITSFRLPFDEAQLEIPDEDKTNPFPEQPQGFINNNPPKNNPIISGNQGGGGGGGGGARRGGRRQQGGGKENRRRPQQAKKKSQGGRSSTNRGATKRQTKGKGKFFGSCIFVSGFFQLFSSPVSRSLLTK